MIPSDIVNLAARSGTTGLLLALAMLLMFITMFMTGQIRAKREVKDRDVQIDRLTQQVDKQIQTTERQQELFNQALRMIKEDLLPRMRVAP